VHVDVIEHTIREYSSRFGTDQDLLADLVRLIGSGGDVTSRKEFRGHVTCGAILIDSNSRVLMVHHRILNSWYLPGGHLEPTDESLRDAALRELTEETQIDRSDILPFNTWLDSAPIDVDRHLIPANPDRLEPAHVHWDFRYVFRAASAVQSIQLEEVTAWKYCEPEALPPKLRDRVKSRVQ
jgi:8-oxo-dGTP pyrophosphatase MutT (NUDIX family)